MHLSFFWRQEGEGTVQPVDVVQQPVNDDSDTSATGDDGPRSGSSGEEKDSGSESSETDNEDILRLQLETHSNKMLTTFHQRYRSVALLTSIHPFGLGGRCSRTPFLIKLFGTPMNMDKHMPNGGVTSLEKTWNHLLQSFLFLLFKNERTSHPIGSLRIEYWNVR